MSSRVAICLFDEHIDQFDLSQMTVGEAPRKTRLIIPNPNLMLCIKESNPSAPGWVDIVNQFANIENKNVDTASSGAILFLKIKKRIMACCFGSSVTNINRNNIVNDFGLATAFHRIPQKDYKTIESFMLSSNPITNNRSAAIPSYRDSFNLDTYMESVTELSGRLMVNTRNVTIKGKQFYSSPSPLSLKEIRNLCITLLVDYQLALKNIDFIRLTGTKKIKERKLIDYLNDELCKAIKSRSDNVYLIDFEILEKVNNYRFSPKGEKLNEIVIDDLYKDIPNGHDVTIEYLRSKRISVFDWDDQQLVQWPVYKCLFHEQATNVGSYVLYKGNWYEIQNRHLNHLKEYIQNHEIEASSLLLPKWDGNQSENDYNHAAAQATNGQCWDTLLYTNPNYRYGIEFCDVLTENFIMHVKKAVSSSLNSHLLLQATVSAMLLQSDPMLLRWIKVTSKKVFVKNIILKSNNKLKNTDIGYLIVLLSRIKKGTVADSLPFFSLVSFNIILRRINETGRRVNVCMS